VEFGFGSALLEHFRFILSHPETALAFPLRAADIKNVTQ
jgi:hypothetical protein